MSKLKRPILYVKLDCSGCRKVLTFFNNEGIDLDIRDVSKKKSDMDAMVSVSGQTKVPTFECDEFIMADFTIDEFLSDLREFPETGKRIGIGNEQS